MNQKILFKYTTRSRRTNFLRGIDSIINNLANKEDYHILVTIDTDDKTMYPLPTLNCNHTYSSGRSNNKVHAINRDLNAFNYKWDILVNMSDDMKFTEWGFDDIIRRSFLDMDNCVNDFDQCIHFPDQSAGDKLITMSILGIDYYNRFGYIYHPSYKSLYCDNETMDVAKKLRKYKFVDKNIFVHLHPANGNAPNDDQYRYTESFHPIDRTNYELRKANNFGL